MNEDETYFIPICTTLFPCFPVLISSYSASILQQYSLAYSEPYQTSKMDRVVKTVIGKNFITLEIHGFSMILGWKRSRLTH